MRYLLILILTFATGMQAAAQHVFTRQDDMFVFRLTVDATSAYDCVVRSIDITNKKSGRVQRIIPDSVNYIRCNDDTTDIQCFAAEDMNFDGYCDMRLLAMPGVGMGHNLGYYYWTYDTVKHQFREDTLFNDLSDPIFDADGQTVISSEWHGAEGQAQTTYKIYKGKLREVGYNSSELNGYTGNYLESSTKYIYVNGRQVVSYERSQSFDEKHKCVVTTLKKRIGGKLQTVSVVREHAEKSQY